MLQGCGHNPTGADPTPQQWQGILAAALERRLFVFLDNAYQVGGGRGVGWGGVGGGRARVLEQRSRRGQPT